MADKLAESSWTGFTKKHKLELDDGQLRKALAKFDKTDEDKHQPRLDALNDLVEQFRKQIVAQAKRKKELGDKPFALVKDQLSELLEQAEALQKKTQAATAAEKDDEEPDTPVLLTTKMVPLLRELRKGEAQMHAMICTAGKNTAVLIMRRSISPSRRKLLAEAVDAKGGLKYIVGPCTFENKVLTFVVQSPASQLAKRIRQALLEQTEMRFKVKVRGDDGVEEHDGEDEGEEQPGVQPQGTPAPPGGPASAEQIAYVQRLRKVRERYEQALKDQHPEATKLRAVMGFASEKADGQKDYAAASKALEQLEKLLDVSAAGPGAKTPPRPADADEAALGRFAERLKALLTSAKEKAAGFGAAALSGIAQQAASAQGAAKLGEIDRANELLDAIEAAVREGPAAPAGAETSERQGQRGAEDDERRIRERLAGLDERMRPVQEAGGRPASEIRGMVQMLEGQLRAGELERGNLVLERIERIVAEAEEEQERFRRRLTGLVTDLAGAEREVEGQLSTLEKALAASADEELRLIGEAGLQWILGDHGPRLVASVSAVAEAGPAARANAAERALQAVGAYLDHLEASEEIAACDSNDLGIDLSIRSTMAYHLNELGKLLADV